MSNPSFLNVPYRFKAGTLYSQIPESGLGDLTVTRATTPTANLSTRVNAQGFIETVADNVPRLDYPLGGIANGCPALLVEPSAQNLALRSEDFTTTWSATNISVSGNTTGTLDPYGTNLADLLTATASGSARVVQSFGFVSGTTYTYSCFAKAGSGFFGMTMENGGVASGVAVIWNLSTGAFAVSGSVGSGYTLQAHNIENYGNGWYRCSMRVLLGSTITGNIRVNTSNGTMSSAIVQSDNGNTVNVFGAQLETGSVATSYIPTTTAAITRGADVINKTGLSSLIGQTEGTIYAEVDIRNLTNADSVRIVSLTTTTNSNNFIEITKRSSTQLRCDARLNSGSTITFLTVSGFVLGVNKIAFAYQDGNYAMAINGAVTTSAQAGMTSSLNTIILGAAASNIAQFNDRIRATALLPTRLTNAQLQALTT